MLPKGRYLQASDYGVFLDVCLVQTIHRKTCLLPSNTSRQGKLAPSIQVTLCGPIHCTLTVATVNP